MGFRLAMLPAARTGSLGKRTVGLPVLSRKPVRGLVGRAVSEDLGALRPLVFEQPHVLPLEYPLDTRIMLLGL